MLSRAKLPLLAGAMVILLPTWASAQEVFKQLSSQRLDDLLGSLNIQYTKGADEKQGATWYDYKSRGLSLRLWNFAGKDLMIDVFLPKVPWETVNKWNGTAKFSRARLHKDPKNGDESSVIESNLDLAGGVTEETVKHFIRGFDLELANWANTSVPVVSEEETFKHVSPEHLEKILSAMNISFKKGQAKGNNIYYYEFERRNYALRLTNFGGDVLMIDWRTNQAAPLDKLNKWNLNRSYVRAVSYPGSNSYTALEANLDCVGGTSDSIIRYFITQFDGDVAAFDEHLRKE